MRNTTARLRIAWFSPLEVKSFEQQVVFSKSEYVSSLILPLLAGQHEIEVFSVKAGQKVSNFSSKNYLTAWREHEKNPFDVFFYNLENGRHCDFVRLHLGLVPGMTWFHDFTLIDDGPEPILNSPWTQMVDMFHTLSDEKVAAWPDKIDQFLPLRPQALRECGMSFYSIFSAERDLEQFRQINPKRLNLSDMGHYLPFPIDEYNIDLDQSLRSSGDLTIALCSPPQLESHLHSTLQAVSGNSAIHLNWLIDKAERTKCQELLTEFNVSNVNLIEGRNTEVWSNINEEADLAIHLLYTFYQQSNPWLALSLAQGLFCIVLDFSESEYLPLDAAIRIAPGASEVIQLKTIFQSLMSADLRRNEAAYLYALERFEARSVAQELSQLLSKYSPMLKLLSDKWKVMSHLGRTELISQNLFYEELDHFKASSLIFSELNWQ